MRILRSILLLAAGGAIGFLVGSVAGFRTAVHDYVANDAKMLEKHADQMFTSMEDLPEEIQEAIEREEEEEEAGVSRTYD